MSHRDSRPDDDPRSQYGFARAFAEAWLRMNGRPVEQTTGARRIAKMLGLRVDGPDKGHAKKAIVEWHIKALSASKSTPTPADDDFYSSQAWRKARFLALKNSNGRCALCGSLPGKDPLHVDHIKPRSLFPALALDPANLQVLCRDCNLGKSNTDCTDWRAARFAQDADAAGEFSDYAIGKMLNQLQ